MSLVIVLLMMAAAAPFWETTPPAEWTDDEIQKVLHFSPWARLDNLKAPGDGETKTPFDATHFYLATARPMMLAELELRRRTPTEDPWIEEYLEFLEDNRDDYIVLAVHVARPDLLNEKQTQQMEQKSFLHVGSRKQRIVGHFPPSDFDPYLRLVFPREGIPEEGELHFELYLPGVPLPFREVSFGIQSLMYQGRPEY